MPVKLIIAGSRWFDNFRFISEKLDYYTQNLYEITVISGCCDVGKLTFERPDGTKVYGVDGMGERWAEDNGLYCDYYPANWTKFGNSAGPIRNREMGLVATHCIVFPGTRSKGSKSMIEIAEELKLPRRVIRIS